MHFITVYAGVADEEKSTSICHHHEQDTRSVLVYFTHDMQEILIQHSIEDGSTTRSTAAQDEMPNSPCRN
jgi:hypothetical protein